MPLSKKRNKERMQALRRVQPNPDVVQPETDALRAKSKPLKEESNGNVQPKDEAVQPNGVKRFVPYSKDRQRGK